MLAVEEKSTGVEEVFTGAVQVILRRVSFYLYQYKNEQWFQEKVFTGLV
jgi:hypothetical protein